VSARDLAVWGALVVAAVTGVAGLFGALRWYLRAPSRGFWFGVRGGQAVVLAYAILVGALILAKDRPSSGLFYVYALVPVAVGFVAEQLRIDEAAQVGSLPAEQQQAIVLAILRRELGVMALAALVVCVLALRAAGTY
jgi:hypothetical protein